MKEKLDLLKKLYKDFILSRCCKSSLIISYGQEGTSFYLCKSCLKPCETISCESNTFDQEIENN